MGKKDRERVQATLEQIAALLEKLLRESERQREQLENLAEITELAGKGEL